MKHKKVAAALSAAVAGASVLAGIRYAVGKRKPKAEPETAIQEEGLTEGKLRECLLRLFRLYEDSEFDDSAEFLGNGSDPREYEAENYSSQLFPYIKRNMTDVMMMEGDDGTGKEPFAMTDVLFCYPACKIGCEIRELFSDNFVLCLQSEMWILERKRNTGRRKRAKRGRSFTQSRPHRKKCSTLSLTGTGRKKWCIS